VRRAFSAEDPASNAFAEPMAFFRELHEPPLIIGYCVDFIQFLPPGIRAAPEAFQVPGFALLFQSAADHVDAYGRAAFTHVLH
jgi:hypothetical protein